MSPANRRNPVRSDLLGAYGWDVFPGFYRIHASRRGCTAPGAGRRHALVVSSPLLPVPPAQTGVDLVLRCPGLHRSGVHVRLKVKPAASRLGTYDLVATVSGRGGRPQGYVTFALGHRRLGEVLLAPRTGTALWSLPAAARPRGTVTISYAGDALHAPGRARAVLR